MPGATSTRPVGALLVGSIPVGSAADAFDLAARKLGPRLRSYPDGETGGRQVYVVWQWTSFPRAILTPIVCMIAGVEYTGPAPDGFKVEPDDIKPTRYDAEAIESYKLFKKARAAGNLPKNARFQVSLPTPATVVWANVDPRFRSVVEPIYEQRMLYSIRRIQEAIPAADLAIQFDFGIEFGILEAHGGRALGPMYPPGALDPWFRKGEDPAALNEVLIKRAARMCNAVDHEVELGLHLCYGDINNAHFLDPQDTGLLVEFVNGLQRQVTRPVEWVHLPVPKDRTDEAYFEPLRKLSVGDAKLYLGLVHAHDEEGTRKRIDAAQKVYPRSFGISTECGLGRTPTDKLESIFDILATFADPN